MQAKNLLSNLVALTFCSLGFAGCVGESEAGDEENLTSAQKAILGQWQNSAASLREADLIWLTLESKSGKCRFRDSSVAQGSDNLSCGAVASDPAQRQEHSGKCSISASKKTLKLTYPGGVKVTYKYALTNGALTLTKVGEAGKTFDLIKGVEGECTSSATECALGKTYLGMLEDNKSVNITSERLVTAQGAGSLNASEREQLIDAVRVATKKTPANIQEAMKVVDGEEVNLTRFGLTDGRKFKSFEFGLGDNSYGAVYYSDTAYIASKINDGDLMDCSVSATPASEASCSDIGDLTTDFCLPDDDASADFQACLEEEPERYAVAGNCCAAGEQALFCADAGQL